MELLSTPVLSCANGWTPMETFLCISWYQKRCPASSQTPAAPSHPGAEVLHRQGSSHRCGLNSGLMSWICNSLWPGCEGASLGSTEFFLPTPSAAAFHVPSSKTSSWPPFLPPSSPLWIFWPCQRIQYFILSVFFLCLVCWNLLSVKLTWKLLDPMRNWADTCSSTDLLCREKSPMGCSLDKLRSF